MAKAVTWMLIMSVLAAGLALAAPPAVAQAAGCTGPSNDCFANAWTLPTSRPTSFTINNAAATLESREPQDCYEDFSSVWVRFVAQTNGRAYLKMSQPAQFDMEVAAYRGTSLTSLTLVNCDGLAQGWQRDLEFTCTKGQTYYIRVSSLWNQTGSQAFMLEGCGQTGPSYTTGRFVTIAEHESTSGTACWSMVQCRQYVDVDANARLTVDRTTVVGANYGATARVESSGRVAGQGYDLGEVGLFLPGPPPPPGPGPTGLPDTKALVSYVNDLQEWAKSIEVYSDLVQPIVRPSH